MVSSRIDAARKSFDLFHKELEISSVLPLLLLLHTKSFSMYNWIIINILDGYQRFMINRAYLVHLANRADEEELNRHGIIYNGNYWFHFLNDFNFLMSLYVFYVLLSIM